jgi:mannosidase alpha-like ER degradation enhancer 2
MPAHGFGLPRKILVDMALVALVALLPGPVSGQAADSIGGAEVTADSAWQVDAAAEVREAFLHAWRGYRGHAWGHDELLPISEGARDWHAESLLMTPLDAFDTMLLMGLDDEASQAKSLVLERLSFDHDFPVQVFEVTIRSLGGLITAYQMDGDERFLTLAVDLADRLLPAFKSATGMPYRYVHLRSGAVSGPVSNPAEIGTVMLEFGALSRLTGDSYYEYLLKSWLLFEDPDFERMWRESIAAANRFLPDERATGYWYGHVDMDTGERTATRFGALDAFLPAVLALGGDIPRARRLMDSVFRMWTTFGVEPEQLNYVIMEPVSPGYVLRPEAIESAYYLFQLTGDERYRDMGRVMVDSILHYTRTVSGFAALASVVTKEKTDRMESFFLAETLKYAYLLFAPAETLDLESVIFNTEAHPIRRTWE